MEIAKICANHGPLGYEKINNQKQCKECMAIAKRRYEISKKGKTTKYLWHMQNKERLYNKKKQKRAQEKLKILCDRGRLCDLCGEKFKWTLYHITFCQKCRDKLYT